MRKKARSLPNTFGAAKCEDSKGGSSLSRGPHAALYDLDKILNCVIRVLVPQGCWRGGIVRRPWRKSRRRQGMRSC